MTEQDMIAHNKRVYDQNVKTYGKKHTQIYNKIEQKRLHESLGKAIQKKDGYLAMDYGSGDGNLTRQLLSYGVDVVSADVSSKSLEKLRTSYGVETILLNGSDVDNIADDTYDFIGMYSVVHHIPDYLYILENLTKKIKVGGVFYIDHEQSTDYWEHTSEINKFKKEALTFEKKMKKYLRPRNYINKLRTIFIDPHYAEEGDIHVFPDDHLEWEKMLDVITKRCEVVTLENYLQYDSSFKSEVYTKYKDQGLCDTTLCIARRVK